MTTRLIVVDSDDGTVAYTKHISVEELTALMHGCGEAMFNDTEWNCPIYRDGEIAGSSGLNPFEAAFSLQAVAAILGIPGPDDTYDRLCDEEA